MSTTKDEALRLVAALPDDATWHEIVDVVARRAVGRRPDRVRELLAPYGPDASHAEQDAMTREFDVIVERDAEGTYVGSVPALAGCHTQAGTVDVLMERIREAIELCLDVGAGPRDTEYVGVRRVSIQG